MSTIDKIPSPTPKLSISALKFPSSTSILKLSISALKFPSSTSILKLSNLASTLKIYNNPIPSYTPTSNSNLNPILIPTLAFGFDIPLFIPYSTPLGLCSDPFIPYPSAPILCHSYRDYGYLNECMIGLPYVSIIPK